MKAAIINLDSTESMQIKGTNSLLFIVVVSVFIILAKFNYLKRLLKPTIAAMITLEKCIFKLQKGTTNPMSTILAENLDRKLDRMSNKLIRVTGKSHKQKDR